MRIPLAYRTDDYDVGFKYCVGWPKKYLTSDYFVRQEYDSGMFGLFGEPFDVVFKDKLEGISGVNEKYYFPIIVSLSQISNIMEEFTIPNDVVSDIRQNKCKLLIFNSYEGWSWDFWENKVINILRSKYNLEFNHFVIVSANLADTSKLKTVYNNFWERQTRTENLDYITGIGSISIALRKQRNNKFICLNRRPHAGRFAAMTLLHPYKDQGYLSFGVNGQMYDGYFEEQERMFSLTYPETNKIYQEKKIKNILPLVIDDGVNAEIANPVHDWSHDKFYDSFLHICPETYQYYKEGRIFFSEKIWKPMMFMQPFVLVGEPNGLKKLKEIGYKTFDTWIDESYDSIEDNETRISKAIESSIKFFDRPDSQLYADMEKMHNTLTHNIAHLTYRAQMADSNLRNDLERCLYE